MLNNKNIIKIYIERYLWGNFTEWLEANGVPKITLKLAHFEASGRGVAAGSDIQVRIGVD